MKHIEKKYLINIIQYSVILTFITICAISCEDEKTNKHTSDIVFPASNISFSQHVKPLFRQTCVDQMCHGSYSGSSLNLEDNPWNALMDHQPILIVTGKGYESPLVMYIDTTGRRSPRMPLMSTPLTQNQIDGVQKWIDEGAQDN